MGMNPILENIAAKHESVRDHFESKGLRVTDNFESKAQSCFLDDIREIIAYVLRVVLRI